jgi:ectoine hydroxylase-related dioxygenase (phytanoyl-CoA dioxygenase family)
MISIKKHVNNILKNGYTIIRKGVDNELANQVISEFDAWSSIPENQFVPFQQERVTNFHMHSKNTLDLVTNTYVNKILSSLLNNEQTVYCSLFFREGSSGGYQRDTPHFYTNPIDQYYGVLYALEDIDVNSGPLKYYIGSHKIENVDGHEIYNSIYTDNDTLDLNTDFRCFIQYTEQTENKCKELKLTEVNIKNNKKIEKGDIFIWHPRLLHGGSEIIDKTLTQYSMVTYNVPINTAVLGSTHFFSKSPTDEYVKNECLFNYIKHNDINIVDHNIGPQVQKTFA